MKAGKRFPVSESEIESEYALAKVTKFAESCGLEYAAEFVPHSRSRFASDPPCLNWRVTLRKGALSLTTDYMQGVGHIPHYNHNFARNATYLEAVRAACETGRSRIREHQNAYDAAQAGGQPLPPPPLVDVLGSLVSDSDALDYSTFEEWADALGYDTDSRKAESTYRACLEIALKLRQLIDLDAARVAFQDY